MTWASNVIANTISGNITNTEKVISKVLLLPPNSANGDALIISFAILWPNTANPPGYNFNIRVGQNSNTSDPAIWSTNNIIDPQTWYNDATAWAQTHPGLNMSLYPPIAPYDPSKFPKVLHTPYKFEGKIIGSVVEKTSNIGMVLVVEPDVAPDEENNLLLLIERANGSSVLGNALFTTSTANLSLTANVIPKTRLEYVGEGQGDANTPGKSLKLVQGQNSNGIVVFTELQIV